MGGLLRALQAILLLAMTIKVVPLLEKIKVGIYNSGCRRYTSVIETAIQNAQDLAQYASLVDASPDPLGFAE